MTETLVAVSHGTADPRGQDVVRRFAEAIRRRLPAVDVRQAFVDVEEPHLDAVLAEVAGPAVVVPLLLGAGFHAQVDIADAVNRRLASGVPTTMTSTLGPDARLTGLLVDRLRQAEVSDADVIVLAVAGSRDVRARLGADRAAAMLATRLRRRVRVGHLGGSGRTLERVLAEARTCLTGGGRVVAVSYLLAPGHFTDRLQASSADVVTSPLAAGLQLDDRLVDIVVNRHATASQERWLRLG